MDVFPNKSTSTGGSSDVCHSISSLLSFGHSWAASVWQSMQGGTTLTFVVTGSLVMLTQRTYDTFEDVDDDEKIISDRSTLVTGGFSKVEVTLVGTEFTWRIFDTFDDVSDDDK